MPKRRIPARSSRDDSEPESFIPKPPPRKSAERPGVGSLPEPGQRFLPQHPSRASTELGDPTASRKRPDFSSVPLPGARPRRPQTEGLTERLEADIRTMEGLLTASKPAAEPAGNELIVPMICSRANVTVLVRFRRQFLGQTWKFENALVTGDGGKAGVEPAPMTVSVFEMDWRGAKCPVCKADCGPILCDCQRLGCHGGVSFSALNQRFYRCPCGAYGPIEPGLKSVSASKGMTAREAQVRATASEPAAPFGFLALPKPR